jgi:hypothetical protein
MASMADDYFRRFWAEQPKGQRMRTTKKQTKRTGTKARTTRNAGRTAKRAETFKVPRTAKQLAAGIQERMKRSPNYWTEVRDAMLERPDIQRAAQVMPREHATH